MNREDWREIEAAATLLGLGDLYDPQEWWRARFGEAPAWSGDPSRKR